MSDDPGYLKAEDYAEPRCVLCGEPYGAEPKIKPIPQKRIIEKMNDYMGRRDYAGAERHLLYWLEEAKLGRDEGGELMVRNELIGHYRKIGEKEKAFASIGEALRLLKALGFEGTQSAGTTYTNAATACNAFGENERALALFEKARDAYEKGVDTQAEQGAEKNTDPRLLGGLYNNMALTCVSLRRYAEAKELYQKAIGQMETVPGGGLEIAITCLNMADAMEAEQGMENAEKEICDLLDRSYDLLAHPDAPKDGYYAFVLEKCAPAFSYYGYFLAAEELSKEAAEIYRKNNEQ